jgi:hypothetical protein
VAPELANAVKRYIAGQGLKKSTYLFQASRGMPLSRRNVLHDSLHPILKRMGTENAVSTSSAATVRLGSVRIVCRGIWRKCGWDTRTQGPHGPVCRTATRGREIPPQMVRKDWPWFRCTHRCFATFATKTRSDRFKENSMNMKLLNSSEVVGASRRFSNLVPRSRLNGPWRGRYGTVSETV